MQDFESDTARPAGTLARWCFVAAAAGLLTGVVVGVVALLN